MREDFAHPTKAQKAGKQVNFWSIILPRVITDVLDRIIKEGEDVLGIPGEVIFREGVKKFLLSKVEENNSLIKSLKEKYGASGYLELEEKARRGDVPEHPAWEDVILWEELSRHTEALLGLVRRLEAGETDWGSFN